MLPYTPCDLPRRSLRHNDFHDKAKQIVKDAAGSAASASRSSTQPKRTRTRLHP